MRLSDGFDVMKNPFPPALKVEAWLTGWGPTVMLVGL